MKLDRGVFEKSRNKNGKKKKIIWQKKTNKSIRSSVGNKLQYMSYMVIIHGLHGDISIIPVTF